MDFVLDFYMISVAIFAVVLALIFYKDRKNVERQSFIFLRKTQRGKATLIKIGQKFPRFWKIVGTIGVIVGFLASAYIVYWLIGNTIKMFTTETATSGLAFVLPAITSSASMTPGLLLVPFWYWIISIGMLLLVHEGFHGIMSAMEKIKIKSLGWGALFILPLAFVEPDEQQISKRKSMTQLRVYAAGSFANFLLGGICILILSFGVSGLYTTGGVGYQALIKDYPAASVNFTGTIVGIDNNMIKNMQDLDDALSHIGSNQTITVKTLINETTELEFVLTTIGKPIPEFAPTWMDDFVIGLEGVVPNTIESVRVSGKDWTFLQLDLGYWQYVKENYPHLTDKANEHIEQANEMLEQTQQPGFIGIHT